jgi:hypothetical protein
MTSAGLGGAGVGYFLGMQTESAKLAAAIVLGRLGLKVLDVALSSRAGLAAMHSLRAISPGTPGAARIMANIGTEVAGPRRIERAPLSTPGGNEDPRLRRFLQL